MPKYDDAATFIRGLLGRKSAGVPLDVADDVARAAAPDLRGIDVPATDTMHARNFWNGGSPGARRNWMGGDDHAAASAAVGWDDLSAVDKERAMRGIGYGPRFDAIDVGPLDSAPDFELGSPLWNQLHKSSNSYENLLRNRTPNLRNQNPQLSRIAGQALRDRASAATASRAADAQRAQGMREGLGELGAAAATVGIGAGLSSMYPSGESPAQGDMTDTSGTEDLAAESSPPPATPEAPADYSFQARELMGKLNAMRRAAGGEVPEAKQMMAEIDRLLGMSNQQRNAPSYKPPMPTDYHAEAQMLIQKLNAMNQEMGGMSPETPKIMAEVRRLQAMGDQMRNGG
jgi:hypothetical protein